VARFGFIIAALACIGLLVSGFIAARVYNQEQIIERALLARGIDTHMRVVQERLSERELLTRVAVGMVSPDAGFTTDALKPLRAAIDAFKADFVAATWVAHISAAELDQAQAALERSEFAPVAIRNFDDSRLDRSTLGPTLDVVMDIEPRNPNTMRLPGRVIDRNSAFGTTLSEAVSERTPVSSNPTPLPRNGGELGIVLAAPVYREGAASPFGFISFSYRLAPLILANEGGSLFDVALRDPADAKSEFVLNATGHTATLPVTSSRTAPILHNISFGGRSWTLSYYPRLDPEVKASYLARLTMLAGLVLTSLICGLFAYVAHNNLRLSREIITRSSFERRLGAVIAELNHRVKNILAVTQSIVNRTLRPGADVDVARDLLIGRIHAMSHVVSLLSDSYWQGVGLHRLLNSPAVPHASHIKVSGPDVTVSARAAQSLSLVFYELASHARPDAAVQGRISVQWDVTGEGPDSVFHLHWEEADATPETRPDDNDFGAILLDRVAPEALGGRASRYFHETRYVYELTALMETVLDKTELDRTTRLSTLPRPRWRL
jgi:two-component sensor histidine kinase